MKNEIIVAQSRRLCAAVSKSETLRSGNYYGSKSETLRSGSNSLSTITRYPRCAKSPDVNRLLPAAVISILVMRSSETLRSSNTIIMKNEIIVAQSRRLWAAVNYCGSKSETLRSSELLWLKVGDFAQRVVN